MPMQLTRFASSGTRWEPRSRQHILDGIERFPEALRMLFRGGNQGKLLVRI